MTCVTILHVSDLHYTNSNAEDLRIVLNAFFEDVQLMKKENSIEPDLVVFSGDLVEAGENFIDFENAKKEFLEPILDLTNLSSKKLFLCPGNHDIERSTVRKYGFVESGLAQTLCSLEKLNQFIQTAISEPSNYALPLSRLNNYEKFLTDPFFQPPLTDNRFLKSYSTDVKGVTVGVACLNTAWRATGESGDKDRQKLLLGERAVDRADIDLKDTDLKIAVFHHPLDWLSEFDQHAVEHRLYSQFDILLLGHTHRNYPEYRSTPSGTSILSQTGCLYESRAYFNGYQFLLYDVGSRQTHFFIRAYQPNRRAFDAAVNVVRGGHIYFDVPAFTHTQATEDVATFLREFRAFIRERAAIHMSMILGEVNRFSDIKETFVCPPLSTRSEIDAFAREDLTEGKVTYIDVDDVLNSKENHLIYGRRESGKTGLGHFFAVRVSEGLVDSPRIPVLFEFKQLRPGAKPLRRAIRSYFSDYGGSWADYSRDIEQKDLLVLLDDVDFTDQKRVGLLQELVADYPNIRWICFADEVSPFVSIVDASQLEWGGFRTLFIHSLPRKSIRALSQRWCTVTGNDEDQTFSIVMHQINGSRLPRTGYIVGLILWSIQQEKLGERVNEAVLLEHIIEYLLNKASWSGALRREFDFRNQEVLLEEVSFFLRKSGGYAAVNDLLEFIISFLRDNALAFDALEIVDKLIECGILRKIEGEISIKYRCFQEYFCSLYFRENPQAITQLFEGYDYIEYHRELDLMSARHRKHDDLLAQLSNKIEELRPREISEGMFESITDIATTEQTLAVGRERLAEIKKRRVTADEIDELFDAAERRTFGGSFEIGERPLALRKPEEWPDALKYLATLDLFGRALKNAELVRRVTKKTHVEKYLSEWRGVLLCSVHNSVEVLTEVTQIW